MNLSNTISDLFDQGAVMISLGKVPQMEGVLYAQIQTIVKTGPSDGDRMQMVVQSQGRDIAVVLQNCRSQIGHVKELEPISPGPR